MSLERKDVEKIAKLARLSVGEDDIAQITQNLSNILDFVAQLDEVDVAQVTPMAHPLDAAQRLRPDVVSEVDQHTAFQAIAPQVEAGLYLVPKVLD